MNNEVYLIATNGSYAEIINTMDTGSSVFEEDSSLQPVPVPNAKNKSLRGYVPWGDSNLRPNEVITLHRNDEVLSSNMQFNIFCGYGNGLSVTNPDGTEATDKKVLDFFRFNRPTKYLLEQVTDMKHFYFTVCVLILDGEGKNIVRLVHKDAMYCRFETRNPKDGKLEHVFYGDWDKKEAFEEIELLDPMNPLADLMVRMGKLPNDDGKTETPTKTRKFAMVNKIPTPGNNYYPFPPHWSIFNSGWYDIKQMIPSGKKAKFKNGLMLKYQVEVDVKYWEHLFGTENITDPKKRQERIKLEKENIKNFLMGEVNAGKTWFTSKYVDPTGKEQSMITINLINKEKEGGDWIEDTEEASNMECYAQGVHPSLIGATPGKTKGSFSGSDKRELFTMKQALEKSQRDILLEPYFVIKEFNGWDVKFEIPFLMLTTLDEKTDAKVVTNTNPDNQE